MKTPAAPIPPLAGLPPVEVLAGASFRGARLGHFIIGLCVLVCGWAVLTVGGRYVLGWTAGQ